MDSGNSGSIQSSSGGDEEFDSRAESSLSAFLNNPTPPPPPTHVGPFTSNHPHHNHNTHVFDTLSNYLDPIQRSASSLVNLDMVWSKPARSDSNPADLGGLMVSSSSAQNQQAAIISSQFPGQTRGVGAFPTTHHSLPSERGLISVSAANDQQPHNDDDNNNNNTNLVRNPKKRSRASRRAPTTVLTTDTTNFRAMVQEFTGIPAPPFTSSPFPRSRLDLFGTSSIRSGNTHLDPPPPPYLLRPFAHKIQPPPQSQSHPLIPSSTANSTPINYQLSSSSADDLLKQPLMHNPILSFQSILQQAPPKYPLGNPPFFASRNQPTFEIPPAADSHLRMGVFEELGVNHAHVSALHRVSSSISDGALSSVNNNNNNNIMRDPSTEWAHAHRAGTMTNNDGDDGGVLVRSLSATATGTYANLNPAERLTNGKVNYSASSSDFHGDKSPDCAVAARSEGMVESWINCSSD